MASPARRADGLKRWHRRLGLIAALFVLVLAATGLALNHSGEWQWDRVAVRTPWLLRWYGVTLPDELPGYAVDGHWLSQLGGRLFVDRAEAASCLGTLVGVSPVAERLLLAACSEELVLFSADFAVVERIGAAHALPVPVQRVGRFDDRLLLQAGASYYTADLAALRFRAIDAIPEARWSSPEPLPAAILSALEPFAAGDSITRERVLQDLHSGRILGPWGVYLVDLMAVLFVLLAFTGVLAWRRGERGRDSVERDGH